MIPVSWPLGPAELAIAFAVMAVGATIQASIGFGLGLTAAPLLLLIDPALVPGPLLLAGVVLTIFVTLRERTAIDFRGLRYAIGGRVLGTIPAALVVTLLTPGLFEVVFAVLVMIAVVLSAFGWTLRPTRGNVAGGGALSGFMATITGVGGPPIVLLYQKEKGSTVRATLAGFFLFGASLSLVALAIVGRFGLREIGLGLLLVPGVAVGFALSGAFLRYVDRGVLRPAILTLSFAAAVVVLLRSLR